MHCTGIIAEYNPFHNGHSYHIQKTRELTNCDVLICVMSPNFVQRGEPAVCDKWKRAKAAIQHGCDIVIELPFPFATQSASQFAQGAIDCLKLAGVQDIVFGSETNDIEMLKKLCHIDEDAYKDLMQNGLSPVKAYEIIYGTMNANDILGINYIRALENTDIIPYSIKRTNFYHDESISSTIASATAIRKALQQNQDIHHVTCMAEELDDTFSFQNYYPLIQSYLLSMNPEYLSCLFLMDEGIEHHLIKQAKTAQNYDEFINACTSRRYTASRIRRTLVHLINQTTKNTMKELPPLAHIRILAFNETGKTYLKDKKKDIIIASRFNQIPLIYRNMELKATQVYAYPLSGERKQAMMNSELQSPIYVR